MIGLQDAIHLAISPGGRVMSSQIGVEKMSRSDASTSGSYLYISTRSRSSWSILRFR
jgi:hypothetical protein